jgi:hypothetical protein
MISQVVKEKAAVLRMKVWVKDAQIKNRRGNL